MGRLILVACAFVAPLAGCGDSGADGGTDFARLSDLTTRAGRDDLAAIPPDLAGSGDDAAVDASDGGDVACTVDGDCPHGLPRCSEGRCVACLAHDDNCPDGQYCDEARGFSCANGCKDDRGCQAPVASCCAHLCVNLAASDANCGACGLACAGDTSCCAAACIPTRSDPANCGGCGIACAGPNRPGVCSMGVCGGDCASGHADCNGAAKDGCEVDITVDAANCGACGKACAAGPNAVASCVKGVCALACMNGHGDCNGDPRDGCETDLSTLNDCGACGNACPAPANASASCSEGACALGACAAGFADCNKQAKDGCEINLASDPLHCGSCVVECAVFANGRLACVSGMCAGARCTPGFGDCDNDPANGCETDLTTVKNCGACGAACGTIPNGTAACALGSCTVGSCDGTFLDCNLDPKDGCEVDAASDPSHCGDCKTQCIAGGNAAPSCQAGVCGQSCAPGFADCDGDGACETDINSDLANCGGCGTVCGAIANGGVVCAMGQCAVGVCKQGFGDCDGDPGNGCEANLGADPANCGRCQNACQSGLCGETVTADMASLPATWFFNGSAAYDGTAGTAVLTTASGNQTGTLIYATPMLADVFDLSFDFQIGGGSRGDGLAFMLETDGTRAVGGGGGGLGVAGLHGFGIELDTVNNNACGDDNANHLALDDLAMCGGGLPTPLFVNDQPGVDLHGTGFHTMTVHNENGVFGATLDGLIVLSLQKVGNYPAGQPFYFGFGASSGQATDRHEIRNVKISFPTPRCL